MRASPQASKSAVASWRVSPSPCRNYDSEMADAAGSLMAGDRVVAVAAAVGAVVAGMTVLAVQPST